MGNSAAKQPDVMLGNNVTKRVVTGRSHLVTFLCCVDKSDAPVSKLRGHDHVVRHIWELAYEEWLDLQIERFPDPSVKPHSIARLTFPWQGGEDRGRYPRERQLCAGCPAATIATGLQFPSPANRYVNMMPFRLSNLDSLPNYLAPYIPLIKACLLVSNYTSTDVGYLTVDERPTEPGKPQRRPGLHVESPGVLPFADGEEVVRIRNGTYIPGAEHHWGRGMMMRREKVTGGIFMASNVANTTAVWNCQINNESGELIGPHGDVERLRSLLGPPSHLLEAGELVWITDRTPHESLPVPAVVGWDGVSRVPQRQYFRLVLGVVTAWYADHSTPSESGVVPPSSVRIVHGDKFSLYPKLAPRYQHLGTPAQLAEAYALQELRLLLCLMGLGHIYEALKAEGIRSVDALLPHSGQLWKLVGALEQHFGSYDARMRNYEAPAIEQLVSTALMLQHEKCDVRKPAGSAPDLAMLQRVVARLGR